MHKIPRTVRATILAATAAGNWACTGAIGNNFGEGGPAPGSTTPGTVTPGPGGGPTPGPGGLIDGPKPGTPVTPGATTCTPSATVPAVPRTMRLTRKQYINAVRDLLGIEPKDVPVDPKFDGFNRALELEVSEALMRTYRDQAETVAKQFAASVPSKGKALIGCEPSAGATCAASFIESFGKRAYRRPLTADEKTTLTALFNKAGTLIETGDAFSKGVQVVVETLLQSPKFTYRIETSTKAENGLVALSSWEIASRLSFTLANTLPDKELIDLADKDMLRSPDTVAEQADRLLNKTDAGRATVRDFHNQWLRSDGWTVHLEKDPVKYPNVTPAVLPTLVKEIEMLAEDVAFTQKKGLASLLTSPVAFVSKVTAPYYDVQGNFGDEPTKVNLDPARRAGVLTQVPFLMGNALSTQSSPIHRGVAIQRYVLCTNIPDPTVQVPVLPPPSAGKTTRQVVDQHTADATCVGCHHNLINPVGYGLENFDAVGKWRDKDNNLDVDASGTLAGTAAETSFKNGLEMSKAIAASPEANRCYVTQWWRYTFGRKDVVADACAIEALAKSVADDNYGPTKLLVDMTRTKAFMYRSPEAL